MNWQRYIKAFKSYLQLERSLSPNSVEAYVRDVEKLANFLKHTKNVGPTEVSYEDIRSFILQLSELQINPRSQSRILSGVKSFYKFLLLEDIIKDDPTDLVEAPKIGRKLPEFLNIEEIDKLIDCIDLSSAEGERNKAIIETLYSCGLRVSELINLKMSNIMQEEGFIKVVGKGNKERLVPIGKTALKYIDFYLEHKRNHQKIKKHSEDILFLNRNGGQLTRVMIFTIVKRLSKLAGLEKNISPHTFRHSFATHLVDGGADLRAVQDMLGHESITTTEIYTHLDRQYLQAAILEFHPRGKK